MAASILTTADQNALGDVFFDVFLTFARPITIFQTATTTVVSTNPLNNHLYQNALNNSSVVTTIQSGVYNACILYGKREDVQPFAGGGLSQNQVRLAEGEVRIDVDPTGSAYLAKAERIQLDGTSFVAVTNPRPHGMFKVDFNSYYFKKVQ